MFVLVLVGGGSGGPSLTYRRLFEHDAQRWRRIVGSREEVRFLAAAFRLALALKQRGGGNDGQQPLANGISL